MTQIVISYRDTEQPFTVPSSWSDQQYLRHLQQLTGIEAHELLLLQPGGYLMEGVPDFVQTGRPVYDMVRRHRHNDVVRVGYVDRLNNPKYGSWDEAVAQRISTDRTNRITVILDDHSYTTHVSIDGNLATVQQQLYRLTRIPPCDQMLAIVDNSAENDFPMSVVGGNAAGSDYDKPVSHWLHHDSIVGIYRASCRTELMELEVLKWKQWLTVQRSRLVAQQAEQNTAEDRKQRDAEFRRPGGAPPGVDPPVPVMKLCSRVWHSDSPLQQLAFHHQGKTICMGCSSMCRIADIAKVRQGAIETFTCQCSHITDVDGSSSCYYAHHPAERQLHGNDLQLAIDRITYWAGERAKRDEAVETVKLKEVQDLLSLFIMSKVTMRTFVEHSCSQPNCPSDEWKQVLYAVMPLHRLHTQLMAQHGNIEIGGPLYQHEMLLLLCQWFSTNYWTTSDAPACPTCDGVSPTPSPSTQTPSSHRPIEMHMMCGRCGAANTADALTLRQGNHQQACMPLTLMLSSLQYHVRDIEILPFRNVCLEVWSDHQTRWVHIDPADGVIDGPLMYDYTSTRHPVVLAIANGIHHVADVTARYSRNPKAILQQREGMLPQSQIDKLIAVANEDKQLLISAAFQQQLFLSSMADFADLQQRSERSYITDDELTTADKTKCTFKTYETTSKPLEMLELTIHFVDVNQKTAQQTVRLPAIYPLPTVQQAIYAISGVSEKQQLVNGFTVVKHNGMHCPVMGENTSVTTTLPELITAGMPAHVTVHRIHPASADADWRAPYWKKNQQSVDRHVSEQLSANAIQQSSSTTSNGTLYRISIEVNGQTRFLQLPSPCTALELQTLITPLVTIPPERQLLFGAVEHPALIGVFSSDVQLHWAPHHSMNTLALFDTTDPYLQRSVALFLNANQVERRLAYVGMRAAHGEATELSEDNVVILMSRTCTRSLLGKDAQAVQPLLGGRCLACRLKCTSNNTRDKTLNDNTPATCSCGPTCQLYNERDLITDDTKRQELVEALAETYTMTAKACEQKKTEAMEQWMKLADQQHLGVMSKDRLLRTDDAYVNAYKSVIPLDRIVQSMDADSSVITDIDHKQRDQLLQHVLSWLAHEWLFLDTKTVICPQCNPNSPIKDLYQTLGSQPKGAGVNEEKAEGQDKDPRMLQGCGQCGFAFIVTLRTNRHPPPMLVPQLVAAFLMALGYEVRLVMRGDDKTHNEVWSRVESRWVHVDVLHRLYDQPLAYQYNDALPNPPLHYLAVAMFQVTDVTQHYTTMSADTLQQKRSAVADELQWRQFIDAFNRKITERQKERAAEAVAVDKQRALLEPTSLEVPRSLVARGLLPALDLLSPRTAIPFSLLVRAYVSQLRHGCGQLQEDRYHSAHCQSHSKASVGVTARTAVKLAKQHNTAHLCQYLHWTTAPL